MLNSTIFVAYIVFNNGITAVSPTIYVESLDSCKDNITSLSKHMSNDNRIKSFGLYCNGSGKVISILGKGN